MFQNIEINELNIFQPCPEKKKYDKKKSGKCFRIRRTLRTLWDKKPNLATFGRRGRGLLVVK